MNPEKAAEDLFNFLNITAQPVLSDAIFILGGSSLAPVTEAIRLYRLGFATKIVFISTGGTFGGSEVWRMPENQKYKEELLKAGISEKAIVSAGLTTNTLMEAKAAIPFMKEVGINPSRLILTSRPFHQRRALLTFQKQHPETNYINCPGVEALDPTDTQSLRRMLQEIERLDIYSVKGDIESPQIPKNVREAVTTITEGLQ